MMTLVVGWPRHLLGTGGSVFFLFLISRDVIGALTNAWMLYFRPVVHWPSVLFRP